MRLEDQCVSLELAKRLKELGFKQESLFYWYHALGTEDDFWSVKYQPTKPYQDFSAYTVAELGEMLPIKFYEKFKGDVKLSIRKFHFQGHIEWELTYSGNDIRPHYQQDRHLADAMARMLIYLKESKLI